MGASKQLFIEQQDQVQRLRNNIFSVLDAKDTAHYQFIKLINDLVKHGMYSKAMEYMDEELLNE